MGFRALTAFTILFSTHPALAENTSRTSCLAEVASDCAAHPSKLKESLKVVCEAKLSDLKCDVMKKTAKPENKTKFASCANPETLCDQVVTNKSIQIYSCLSGVGGVMVDAVLGLILLPKALYDGVMALPQIPRRFQKCQRDDESKKLYMGDLRPANMTDASISRMSCYDISQFVQTKVDVIMARLEERRQAEALKQNRDGLKVSELKLTNDEIAAIQFDLAHAGRLQEAQCYNSEDALKAACASLAEGAMSVASMTPLAKLARLQELAEDAAVTKNLAEARTAPVVVAATAASAAEETLDIRDPTAKEFEELDNKLFNTYEDNLLEVERGSPQYTEEANAQIIKDMNSYPTPKQLGRRLSGLSKDAIQKLYDKVYNNKVAGVCAKGSYDPSGEIGFCFGRATAAHIEALRTGLDKTQIRKIWAVGNMKGDSTGWKFHVTTVVRNLEGKWIAIDPLLPKPVTLEEWYAHFKAEDLDHDMRIFSTQANRAGVGRPDKYSTGHFNRRIFRGYFQDLMQSFRDEIEDLKNQSHQSDAEHPN